MTDIICISPVDGREYARRPVLADAQLQAVLSKARAAQKDWARVPLAARAKLLLAFLEAIRAMDADIVPELTWQMGRPVCYGGEFRSFEERVRSIIDQAAAALAPSPAYDTRPGFERFIAREPVGIVFTVAPWNYPYLTAANSIIPALMAGNAVVLKHAAQTLLVGERFGQAFAKAGLPEGLFANVTLSHEQTGRLIASGAVNHVNFTGSVEAGRSIERAAAGTFTSIALELGGKDPAYVRADANLDATIAALVDGAFFNSGQCCCGIERIYVHASLYDDFVEGAAALTSQYVLGDPFDTATTLGPMAHVRFANVVRDHTAEALAKGARAHIDPRTFAADAPGTAYLAPQMLTNVDHTMRVMSEESFGPVLGIMKVADDAEAIHLMNDSRYGLTASIWTADLDAAKSIGADVQTGTVFMNRCDYVDPGLAWTGVKDTGRGAVLSRLGYDGLTRPKSYHLRREF